MNFFTGESLDVTRLRKPAEFVKDFTALLRFCNKILYHFVNFFTAMLKICNKILRRFVKKISKNITKKTLFGRGFRGIIEVRKRLGRTVQPRERYTMQIISYDENLSCAVGVKAIHRGRGFSKGIVTWTRNQAEWGADYDLQDLHFVRGLSSFAPEKIVGK